MSIAIAHDYLTQRGGAERVVLSMLKAFPDATLHTLLYDPDRTYPEFRDARIVTSPLNRIAALRRRHRAALPLLPYAAGRMPIRDDVVLASSSGWAHGFDITGRVVVYCHAPARWLYQSEDYLGASGALSPRRIGLGLTASSLRRWDARHAARADTYLANSHVVRSRIAETYGRDAEVVAPPHSVETTGARTAPAALADWADGGYHLVVSRLLPYKHVDRVIEAFAGLPGERLVVVGAGPERDRLRALAGAGVRLVQDLTDAELRWTYAHSRALVAASHEDFGLTPLEAGAFGKPTVALRAGGYLDTIADGVNGLFFERPEAADIRAAVVRAGRTRWVPALIEAHADTFSEARFVDRLREIVAGQPVAGVPVAGQPVAGEPALAAAAA